MNSLYNETELAYCDSCGNYVPATEVEGDLYCKYELDEYQDIDIATLVG